MDAPNTSDTTKTSESTEVTPFRFNPKVLLRPPYLIIEAIALLLLVVIAVLAFSNLKTKPTATNQIFNPTTPVIKVGEETIYGNLLNDLASQVIAETPIISTDNLMAEVKEQAKTQSAIIQGGIKENLVPNSQITPGVFNSATVSSEERTNLVNQITKEVTSNQPVSGIELISTWYYNTKPPSIPQNEATTYAKNLITRLRADLLSNKLTFQQAADVIRNDQTMPKIDPSYKGNSYLKQEVSLNSTNVVLGDKNIDSFVRSSNPGTISGVIDSRPQSLQPGSQAYFVVVKVNSKDNQDSTSFSNWLSQQLSDYQATNL